MSSYVCEKALSWLCLLRNLMATIHEPLGVYGKPGWMATLASVHSVLNHSLFGSLENKND